MKFWSGGTLQCRSFCCIGQVAALLLVEG